MTATVAVPTYPRPSWFDGDPFTMGLTLCDKEGVVRNDEYPSGYTCTGHAHRHGEHIECLSEYHRLPPVSFPVTQHVFSFVVQPTNDGYACLRIARELRELLAGAEPDDETRSLRKDVEALERVGNWLTTSKPILTGQALVANSVTFAGP